MAPAKRSGGTSARAPKRPENSRVSPFDDVSVAFLLDPSDIEVFDGAKLFLKCLAGSFSALITVCEHLAEAVVGDHHGNIGQFLPLFFLDHRIEQAKQQCGRCQQPDECTASAEETPAATAMSAAAPSTQMLHKGNQRIYVNGPRHNLLSEPFEQGRHMYLVRLVVSGQRVHHNVDAASVGEFTLSLAAGHDRKHRLALQVHGPRGRIVVGSIMIDDTPSKLDEPRRRCSESSVWEASTHNRPPAHRPGKVCNR